MAEVTLGGFADGSVLEALEGEFAAVAARMAQYVQDFRGKKGTAKLTFVASFAADEDGFVTVKAKIGQSLPVLPESEVVTAPRVVRGGQLSLFDSVLDQADVDVNAA